MPLRTITAPVTRIASPPPIAAMHATCSGSRPDLTSPALRPAPDAPRMTAFCPKPLSSALTSRVSASSAPIVTMGSWMSNATSIRPATTPRSRRPSRRRRRSRSIVRPVRRWSVLLGVAIAFVGVMVLHAISSDVDPIREVMSHYANGSHGR